jgi:hypothetical protein
MAMGKNRAAKDDAMRGPEEEPALDELLSDPMTKALMASDGVEPRRIKELLIEAQGRYQAAPSGTVRRRH